MTRKSFSAAAERNGAAIQDVLVVEFAHCHSVLEIGSGTGQHAVRLAAALPHLRWQCSDVEDNRSGIEARLADDGQQPHLDPLTLDVRTVGDLAQRYDAVYSSNTAHIMSFPTVEKMFAVVRRALNAGGLFCLYGPFRQDGQFNAPSNAAFHKSLRERDASMGIRHLEALDELGLKHELSRVRLYAMPANNYLAVWRKEIQ